MFPFLKASFPFENVRRGNDKGVDYFQCRCPICALDGGDSLKSHLRIYKTGAFVCAKFQKGEVSDVDTTTHNRLIRSLIRNDSSSDVAAEVVFIDPEPTIETDKVYPESVLSELVPDYSYWVGRGITPEVLMKLESGLAPSTMKGKLSGRYVFPIRSQTGHIMGFSGRLVGENSFAPVWKHLVRSSKCVYPLNVSGDSIRRNRRVVLVESIGDALSLMTAGIPEVLVLLGLSLNSRIMGALVAANPSRIFISTNNDLKGAKNWGELGAGKVHRKLKGLFNEERLIVRLPQQGNDWNSTTQEERLAFKGEIEG